MVDIKYLGVDEEDQSMHGIKFEFDGDEFVKDRVVVWIDAKTKNIDYILVNGIYEDRTSKQIKILTLLSSCRYTPIVLAIKAGEIVESYYEDRASG